MRQAILDKMRRDGITQVELAKILKLSQPHVSKHLRGKRVPDAEARNRYAKWLGLEPLEWK